MFTCIWEPLALHVCGNAFVCKWVGAINLTLPNLTHAYVMKKMKCGEYDTRYLDAYFPKVVLNKVEHLADAH